MRRIAIAVMMGSALMSASTWAQHARDKTTQVPGVPPRVPLAFAPAYLAMRDSIERLKSAIDASDIPAAHASADAAGDAASDLILSIRTPESKIPAERYDDAERAAREVIAGADSLHNFAEKGDLRACGEEYVRMRNALRMFTPFAAPEYYCPMHCEGAKVYGAPGTCPVCHMDLKKITSEKYRVDVRVTKGTLESGKPASLTFSLRDPTNAKVKDVKIVHEKPLHLLMVSNDLSWYAHEHPALQPDGSFVLEMTFPAPGTYTLFHDFTPGDVGQQVVPVALTVPGAIPNPVPLTPDREMSRVVDGYSVSLDSGGAIRTGNATTLRYTVTHDGKAVSDLQPYLGAMGHLVIISKDLKSFVHSHPLEAHDGAVQTHGPTVEFVAHFENPGIYKSWAQFQHGSHVITVPFTFEVTGKRVLLTPRGHTHGTNEKDVGPNSPFKFK